jgi:hypothetical protein
MDTQGDRIRQHSPASANQEIDEQATAMVRAYGSRPDATADRLRHLAGEWDMERALFAATSVNLLISLSLAARSRRWLAYTMVVAAFQLQHAVQGWCPPVSVLRRFGFRTRQEIDRERVALKAVRGDFTDIRPETASLDPASALVAAAR